jgi:ornithine cyclodeaminase
MFDFHVVPGRAIQELIVANRGTIISIVEAAYRAHHAGGSVNPDSFFLRFPDKSNARIIALPAYLGGDCGMAGIKWISSFPDNIKHSIPRASAIMVLNDFETGHPRACLEASLISASRTAASAVFAVRHLARRPPATIGVVGAGIISRNILEYFTDDGWIFTSAVIHDQVPAYAQALADHCRGHLGLAGQTGELAAALAADLVVLATTASEPYITDPRTFSPGQVVLNVSLRDLAPEVILAGQNVVDDIDHCLKANTSVHLTEQRVGHRGFIAGTIAGLALGEFAITADRPVIFSPFGLGILDLAVGKHLLDRALAEGTAYHIQDFFAETTRWAGAQQRQAV